MRADGIIDALFTEVAIAETRVSPTGSHVAYLRRDADVARNLYRHAWWLAATRAQVPHQRVGDAVEASDLWPRLGLEWSPTSDSLVVLQPDAAVRVFRVDGDEPIQACTVECPGAIGVRGVAWSPSGEHVAVLTETPPVVAEHGTAVAIDLTTVFFRNIVEGTVIDAQRPPPRGRLWLLSAATGDLRALTDEAVDVSSCRWTADGTSVLCQVRVDGAAQSWLVDVDGDNRIERCHDAVPPAWVLDPSGRWRARRSRADFFQPPPIEPRDDHGDLAAMPTLAAVPDVLRGEQVTWADDVLLFASDYQMARQLFRVRPGADPEQLATADGAHSYGSFSEGGDVIAFVREGVVATPEVCVASKSALAAGEFTPRVLFSGPPGGLGVRFLRTRWRSDDDEFHLDGYVVLPPQSEGTGPYPTLIDVAGGPTMVRLQRWSHFPNDAFAAAGYAVFVPNTRGRFGGYDRRFCHWIESSGFQLRDPFADILSGVDHLVSEGIADPARLGLMGHSYGAVVTAYGVTQTARFRAASFHEGMVDQIRLLRLYGGDAGALADLRHITGYGAPYDETELRRIRTESPLDNVHRATTPTLVEAGELSLVDDAVLLAKGLHHHGVPCELNVDPRTKHVVSEPRLVAASIRRNLAWFDYWVRDVPYPDAERQREYDGWKARHPDRYGTTGKS